MEKTQIGKAYKFAVAQALNKNLGLGIANNQEHSTAHTSYTALNTSDKAKFDISGSKVAKFLKRNEHKIQSGAFATMQSDATGNKGDVRDLILNCKNNVIGISAKSRSTTFKNPRLSKDLDFGLKWCGQPVSTFYWNQVNPIFANMEYLRQQGILFSQVNKKLDFYDTFLDAFENEINILKNNVNFVLNLFDYVVGNLDYYKVTCFARKTKIESINVNGTLSWGNKLNFPNIITNINRDPNKSDTLLITFKDNSVMSFRIHNAEKKVVPTLKFDINYVSSLIGVIEIDH